MPPVKRAGVVLRQRLTARVARAAMQRLVLVSAPAGYGKTSVLAEAYASLADQGKAVAWLSLDEDDNDLSRFLLYSIEAARRAGLRIGQATTAIIHSGVTVTPEILKTTFINELSFVDQDFFWFLDDYHLVSDPGIAQILNAILLSPLARVHLLLATRTPTSLPLSRLRGLGDAHEIEAVDLTFSEEEIGHFFALHGTPLDTPLTLQVKGKTEGWAASLQMLAIAARATTDLDEVLRHFSGENHSIGDFLSDEVLKRQPKEVQEFLLATSILRRFNSDLCNAVMQRRDSRELLDRLEAANLFIFSLDQEHRWYRYHHLFSEFLRRRLADRHPEQAANYYRRACEWLAANRYMTDAVETAFAAGDLWRAGELLDAASSQLFATGQTATLHAYAARLPGEILKALCQLQFELAWDYQIQWRFGAARAALENVRRALQRPPRPGRSPLTDAERTSIRNTLAHREMTLAVFTDDYVGALAMCRKWQAECASEDPFTCASAGTVIMLCEREHYHCEGVDVAATTYRRRFLEGSGFYGTVFHDVATGGTLFMRGDLKSAVERYRSARVSAVELHGEQSSLAAMPSMLLAEVLYEQNDVKASLAILDQYAEISCEFGFLDNAIARYLTESRLARYFGDPTRADRVLENGAETAIRGGFRRLEVQVLAERVRQLIADGHARDAIKLVEGRRYRQWFSVLTPGRDTDTTLEQLAITYARVCCERGRVADALAIVRRWTAFTRDRQCFRPAVRLSILLAKLLARSGEGLAAQRAMVDALSCGEQGQFMRSFVDEGPCALSLLRETVDALPDTHEARRIYGKRIIDAFGFNERARPETLPEDEFGDDNHTEALSEREIEIVKLSADNLDTREIGHALGLSEGTVKWYWQRIFSKLHVHKRAHAVRLARRQGLLH